MSSLDLALLLATAASDVASKSTKTRIKRIDKAFGTQGFLSFVTREDATTALRGLQRLGIMCTYSRAKEDLGALPGPPPPRYSSYASSSSAHRSRSPPPAQDWPYAPSTSST